MRGYLLRPSFSRPFKQYGLESFGRTKDQHQGEILQPYYNGLGRTVGQLARVTLKFCKSRPASKGMREFIETDLMNFTRANPGVVVYLKPRMFKSPVMVAEYLNGAYHFQSMNKMKREEVKNWLQFAAGRSGDQIKVYEKEVRTDWPSVQGPWHPFLNKPTNLTVEQFPNADRSKCIIERPTTSQQLMDMAKELINSKKS